MDHLFSKLGAMYPQRWANCFKTDAAIQDWRDTWAEAFDEERIQPHQVKAGISECRKLYDWPPSLTEFIKACRAVKPAAHRDFPLALTHKSSPEVNREGLRRLREAAGKLCAESRMA
jgi:hypothetical protein